MLRDLFMYVYSFHSMFEGTEGEESYFKVLESSKCFKDPRTNAQLQSLRIELLPPTLSPFKAPEQKQCVDSAVKDWGRDHRGLCIRHRT